MKKVLLLGNAHDKVKQYFSNHHETIFAQNQEQLREVLQTQGTSIQAVITSAFMGLKASDIDALPNVEVVCNFGVGYDSTDTVALKAKGIPFSNTPDVLNDAVADTTMSLLLATVRQVCLADRFVRSGQWEKGNFPLSTNLKGKRVGIVGLGSIGKVITKRLSGFDVEIAYHNRRPRTDGVFQYEQSLTALATWADILIIATVGGQSTQHLINADVLKALGAKGYLINISRGSVVDEEALIHALQEGVIAGAGLDVFANEPFVPEALKQLDNVVLMPHLGSATIETRDGMAQLVIDNFEHFYQQGSLLSPI